MEEVSLVHLKISLKRPRSRRLDSWTVGVSMPFVASHVMLSCMQTGDLSVNCLWETWILDMLVIIRLNGCYRPVEFLKCWKYGTGYTNVNNFALSSVYMWKLVSDLGKESKLHESETMCSEKHLDLKVSNLEYYTGRNSVIYTDHFVLRWLSPGLLSCVVC
jgi:hypothetical protein